MGHLEPMVLMCSIIFRKNIRSSDWRYSEMHQSRRGNQWVFGMKAHIGADSWSKLNYSVATTKEFYYVTS